MNEHRPLVLVHIQRTLASKARSGVERVVFELAKTLPMTTSVEFVKWDYSDGQLRYLDCLDLDRLFRGKVPTSVSANRCAHRVNYRFGDTLPKARPVWMLFPEIAYHAEDGTDVVTRILAMCVEYGVRTAALFYDAIPVTNVRYRNFRREHSRYIAQLSRLDRIYAISHHSKRELESLYRRFVSDDAQFGDLQRRITAAPLGEIDDDRETLPGKGASGARNKILLLGTVEPRKQQVEVLKGLKTLPADLLTRIEVHVLGSLHPEVATEFNALVASMSIVHYHGYASQGAIDRLFDEALFSIFASTDEGFGLPITESLARGVPCLTANFGSMGEIARGGGCLMVDVRQKAQLVVGVTRLLTDLPFLVELRNDIKRRRWRTWRDYAWQLVEDMDAASTNDAAVEAELRKEIAEVLASSVALPVATSCTRQIRLAQGSPEAVLVVDAGEAESVAGPRVIGMEMPREFRVVTGDWTPSRRAQLGQSVNALAWALRSSKTLGDIIEECRRASCPTMLPPICVVEEDPSRLASRTCEELVQYFRRAARRREVAERESLVMDISRRWPDSKPHGQPSLSIVISTFNRAAFVRENVRWLLSLLQTCPEDVRLVVVDNASTDDTLDRLSEFRGARQLSIVSNPVNVGMLGNLRVCAGLMGARYVWLIGDDDFITPDGLGEVLEVLHQHPETPLIAVNFGVYQRAALGPNDSAENLMSDRAALSAIPSPSGFYPIARIAEEHDNLFTAIYPLVMRSDLLSACFNHPFDRQPFIDLVESVPTTRTLLETYADTQAYWCSRLGIVGNLSNSWSVHRPRWHAVLMPRVLRLAHEVGVDPVKLNQWSRVHLALFREAERWARSNCASLNISADELESSHLVFREKLPLEPRRETSEGRSW